MRRLALLALPVPALVLAAAVPLAGCESTVNLGAAPAPSGTTTTTPGVRPQADKVDLLFAVDDSASMADKQHVLSSTVPRLVERFVHPRCLDGAGAPNGFTASSTGACTSGTPEFKPVTDIHIGVVTSSMGNFGTTATCDTKGTNLRGHLVNDGRIAPIAHEPSGFLAYTGNAASAGVGPLNPYTDAEKFAASFGMFINNLQESGCGYESQLESVQHFLMQPDPWNAIVRNADTARYDGVDRDLLAQRKAFLRPDSDVVVVMLTDEDDSSVDPLALQGHGWLYMANSSNGLTFPTYGKSGSGDQQSRTDLRYGVGATAPGGTSACKTDPNSVACIPCWASKDRDSDPSCQQTLTQEEDPSDLRMSSMKRRFGWDPQYPVRRYIDGFSAARVPDRRGEHDASGNYVGDANCVNPLFAKALPDPTDDLDTLCNLEAGPRDPSQVFFAVVGGVPEDLLRTDGSLAKPRKTALSGDDWQKILGANPATGDAAGIDPRMIASATPRGVTQPGYDWDSKKGDLMFACTFELPKSDQRTGTTGFTTPSTSVESTVFACSKYWDSPLCDRPLTTNDATDTTLRTQVRAAAYPTLRPLRVAKGLGNQAIVGSICPTNLADPTSADYAYRPTIDAIVDRVSGTLVEQP